MKKVFVGSLLLIFCMSLISCEDGMDGADGKDGEAYLKIDWDYYVDTYDDNNPDIPSSVTRNSDYNVIAGTYNFLYTCSDGFGSQWYWEGYYTIEINHGESGEPGEEATLFSDGADGADGADGQDNRYRLYLDGITGISFTLTKDISFRKILKSSLYRADSNFDKSQYYPVGEGVLSEYHKTDYKMIVFKQLYKKN